MRALRTVAPRAADALRARSPEASPARGRVVDCDGRKHGTGRRFVETQFGDGGEEVVKVRWSEVQEVLLEQMPGEVDVETEMQAIRVESVEGAVRVVCLKGRKKHNMFANWGGDPLAGRDEATGRRRVVEGEEGEKEAVELLGRIVIGADGINSVCRAAVYREIGGVEWERVARAEYSGFVSFKGFGKIPNTCAAAGEEFEERFGSGSLYAREKDWTSVSPLCMVFHLPPEVWSKPGKFMGQEWIFLINFCVEENAACRNAEAGGHSALYDFALAALTELNYPDCILCLARSLLGEADELHAVRARPLYVIPVVHPAPFELRSTAGAAREYPEGFYRPFGCGRIFLAGDALHGMPPNLAQGMAMGFEDCCELVDLLAEKCRWADVAKGMHFDCDQAVLFEILEAYKSARIDRLVTVQKGIMNAPNPYDETEQDVFYSKLLNFRARASGWGNL